MVTRLSDVIVPEVFNQYMMVNTMEKSAIFQSGIMRSDPTMATFLGGGGRTVNVPFWNDLANDEPNISSDDPGSEATPKKVTASKDIAIRNNRNQAWSSADLAADLAGSDPMRRIADRVSAYWVRAFQKNMVADLTGVFADNAANDGGDMQNVIGADAVGDPTDAELISAEAVLDTAQTMGDAQTSLQLLLMHSVVYNRLNKLNLIDFIPDSNGVVNFPSYLGYNVVVDDGCPAIVGTTNADRTLYSTYLVGPGAFCWGENPPRIPVEVDRKPAQGDGGGIEQLWTRRQYLMHPYGIAWTDTTIVGQSPTNAECEDAANWNRVYPERKQIRLAELITNG